jgi:hypothetical protein
LAHSLGVKAVSCAPSHCPAAKTVFWALGTAWEAGGARNFASSQTLHSAASELAHGLRRVQTQRQAACQPEAGGECSAG